VGRFLPPKNQDARDRGYRQVPRKASAPDPLERLRKQVTARFTQLLASINQAPLERWRQAYNAVTQRNHAAQSRWAASQYRPSGYGRYYDGATESSTPPPTPEPTPPQPALITQFRVIYKKLPGGKLLWSVVQMDGKPIKGAPSLLTADP
jgi:hypothetical protein